MIILIITLPLLSFCFCLLGGSRIKSEKGLQWFIGIVWVCTWLLTILLFCFYINSGINMRINFIEWFKLNSIHIIWCVEINKVTLTMLLLVITISSLVHGFSLNYMAGDPHLSRFISYLSLFTFFMLILILSPNLVQLFIGWEGVGVCSYLLINFWSTRLLAAQSAYKAMAVNKIGDMALLLAMGLIIKIIGSIDINLINCSYSINSYNNPLKTIIIILLLIGVIGKSAQIGLHMWLPDAMEGPTPVSALIHAATMVTAGVFLVIKLSPLINSDDKINFLILFTGGITCFMAAIIGSTQSDLKKIIAYSTCSQLGYMVMVCGYGYFSVSLFHLFNHGIFKALLFLSAGLIIHTVFNEQNLLKMGLKNISPIGKLGFIIGNLAITGFPFLTGFYSKDLFLELIAANNSYFFPLWLGYLAASLTCFYSLKLLYISYNKESRYPILFKFNFHNNSLFLSIPLIILSSGSIILGFVVFKSLNNPIKPIIVSNLAKQIPLLILVFIVMLAVFKSHKIISSFIPKSFVKMFVNSFYFNELIGKTSLVSSYPSYNNSYKLIDSQVIEWFSSSQSKWWSLKTASLTSIFHPIKINLIVRSLIVSIILFIYFI